MQTFYRALAAIALALMATLVVTQVADAASANTWSTAGALNTPRQYHTATLLASGQALVAGGSDDGNLLASAELYSPARTTGSTAGAPVPTLDGRMLLLLAGWLGAFAALRLRRG